MSYPARPMVPPDRRHPPRAGYQHEPAVRDVVASHGRAGARPAAISGQVVDLEGHTRVDPRWRIADPALDQIWFMAPPRVRGSALASVAANTNIVTPSMRTRTRARLR